MKLLIQLTFNNGLGNLYCGAVDIINFVRKHKEWGYSAELIFASNGNAGGNKFIDFVEFEEIFDLEEFKIFDNIRSVHGSISSKEFEGYTYHSTQYGPNYPGAHWWDVFFDVVPKEEYPKYSHSMETLLSNQQIPEYLPRLNQKVYDKVNDFKKNNFDIDKVIQVRYLDYFLNPPEDFKNFTEQLYSKVEKSENKFYLMSNNQYIIDKLSELPNIVLYSYNHLDKLPNDHSYFFYHKHIDRSILLDRLYDNLAEMTLLSEYETIYFYTSYSWMSTFLYYSKANNKNQNLINITNNLDLIQ